MRNILPFFFHLIHLFPALSPLFLSSFLIFFFTVPIQPQPQPNSIRPSHPPPFIPPLLHLLTTLIFLGGILMPQPMENHHQNPQEREHQSTHPTSPNSNSTTSSSNGVAVAVMAAAAQVPPPSIPQPPMPKSIPRSIESNPYPTTIIQADTSSFKHVVQMLTGSAETAAKHAANPPPPKSPIPPAAKATGPKKPAFKLYERRSSLKNLKTISPLIPTFLNSSPSSPAGAAAFSPRNQPEILSPSILDLPSLVLSPVTPLIPDPFNRSPHPNSTPSPAMSAEDRAIAEKGFYLHPSPRTTPRDAQPPRLLPLFPVTSPRLSSASSSPP